MMGLLLAPGLSNAMALRSFVAMPLEKNGMLVRMIAEENIDSDVTVLMTNFAYGLSAKQTLFIGLPYKFDDPSSGIQNTNFLYRHLIAQSYQGGNVRRFGFLAGAILPKEDQSENRVQAGIVSTVAYRRHQWDMDALWVDGLGEVNDSARFDISWQYRLVPAKRSAWEQSNEWNSIIELGGRWNEISGTTYQYTIGVQWLSRRWVLEGGTVIDINKPEQQRYLLGFRVHL